MARPPPRCGLARKRSSETVSHQWPADSLAGADRSRLFRAVCRWGQSLCHRPAVGSKEFQSDRSVSERGYCRARTCPLPERRGWRDSLETGIRLSLRRELSRWTSRFAPHRKWKALYARHGRQLVLFRGGYRKNSVVAGIQKGFWHFDA